MQLAEGQRPAKHGAQLEVYEDPLDGEERFTVRLVEFQSVDLQAQDERVYGDLLQFQLDTQVIPNSVRGRVLYQPWSKEESEDGIDKNCDGYAD